MLGITIRDPFQELPFKIIFYHLVSDVGTYRAKEMIFDVIITWLRNLQDLAKKKFTLNKSSADLFKDGIYRRCLELTSSITEYSTHHSPQ